MDSQYRVINIEQLKNLLTTIPIVVESESELIFSQARDRQVVIMINFTPNKDTERFNGYSLYYVSSKNIDELNFTDADKANLTKVTLNNGLYAYKIPPVSLCYDKLTDNYDIVSSHYLNSNYDTVLREENIAKTIADVDGTKVASAMSLYLANTKLETILDLLCSTSFIDKDGVVIRDTNVYHRHALRQIEFEVGQSEVVIERKNILSDERITEAKVAKAYITSEPEDNIYPRLVTIVTPEAIKVKAIVNSKPYEATSAFTANVEIAYDFKTKL